MKSIRPTTWLLSGLCALVAGSCTCKKDEPVPDVEQAKTVQVTYDATQCADPWGFTNTGQQLATTAATYLVQHGISSYRHQTITQTNAAACAACTCKRGLLITGTVSQTELAAAVALGFSKL